MYSVRHIDIQDKLSDQLHGHLLLSFFPQEVLDACFEPSLSAKKRRTRVFTRTFFFLQLLMNGLCPEQSQQSVWHALAHPFHLLHPCEVFPSLSTGTLSYQRERFDAEILHRVMKACCKPRCTPPRHPNGFYRGHRLVAIDGTKFNTPDTEANVQAFGRSSNQYGEGPYPQIQAVALIECASRCVLTVVLGTHAQAEIHALPELCTHVEADMLILADCGFFSGWFLEHVQKRIGAQVLCGLSSTVGRRVEQRLSDRSYLTTITPSRGRLHRGTHPVQIRVIEYFLTDARFGLPGRCYRLATTLLDETISPASELIELYRQRWEVETHFREIKSSLRGKINVLRSRTPEGVRQEVYALFLAHYAVGSVKLEAAATRQVDPDRISFTETKHQLTQAIMDSLLGDPSCQPWLLSRLTRHVSLLPLLPAHRLRMNRRELKLYYQKWHRKSREIAPYGAFDREERFLDLVTIWQRPEGMDPRQKEWEAQKAPTPHERIA